METLKFKVGDRVRVKSLEWYNENKDVLGDIIFGKEFIFFDRMAEKCGTVLEITEVCNNYYRTYGNSYVWQEWMLEDEPITEEEQEDKQLNKNDMETKEMTQEEIFAYLNNTKIICMSAKEAQIVQKKLFELGIEWKNRGKDIIEELYLFHIQDNYLKFNSSIESWMRNIDKRIEVKEILAIKIKEEEKPKIDLYGLHPFDKVLVRNDIHEMWSCSFYSHYDNEREYMYACVGSTIYKFCVPYNEETEHLIGTANEAPEFYRI